MKTQSYPLPFVVLSINYFLYSSKNNYAPKGSGKRVTIDIPLSITHMNKYNSFINNNSLLIVQSQRNRKVRFVL